MLPTVAAAYLSWFLIINSFKSVTPKLCDRYGYQHIMVWYTGGNSDYHWHVPVTLSLLVPYQWDFLDPCSTTKQPKSLLPTTVGRSERAARAFPCILHSCITSGSLHKPQFVSHTALKVLHDKQETEWLSNGFGAAKAEANPPPS